jgi:3-phenylpropionate/trans-cinnamate dioxygenase ferredoxin component
VGEWITVGQAADVPAGHAARVEIDDRPIAIFNVEGNFYCLDDTCSHAEASLSDGDLDIERCAIECPLHGSAFDLRSGMPITLPATEPVAAHEVDVSDGELRVRLSEGDAAG